MDRSAQGGKTFGLLKTQQEEKLELINQMPVSDFNGVLLTLSSLYRQGSIKCVTFLTDPKYADEEDLGLKLDSFKKKYMEFDLNNQGEIDLMGLKRMLEKLGVAKTHLELKKMMSEVVGGTSCETISYTGFVSMMLGKRNAILRLILMFQDMGKDQETKEPGPPPRKTFSDLP